LVSTIAVRKPPPVGASAIPSTPCAYNQISKVGACASEHDANKGRNKGGKTTEGPNSGEGGLMYLSKLCGRIHAFQRPLLKKPNAPAPGDAGLQEAPPQEKTQNKTTKLEKLKAKLAGTHA